MDEKINSNNKNSNNKELNNEELNKNSNNENFNSDRIQLHKIKTINRATKYELARIIGTRSSQIQYGSPVVFLKDGKHIDIPKEFNNIKTAEDKAKMELATKSSPMIIKRVKPSGKSEIIPIQELE